MSADLRPNGGAGNQVVVVWSDNAQVTPPLMA
jgi:hypothetical protein